MANTHVVLEGVKDYTLELLGTKARDEAVDAAVRAEAQAERAEAAADNAEVGIRDDTVARQHLTPGLRGEVDGKADQQAVADALAGKSDVGHTHRSADIADAHHYLGEVAYADRVVKTHNNGHIYMRTDPPVAEALARKAYVDTEVAKKADKAHTHTAADVGARPDDWVPTAAQVGARPASWTPTAQDVGAATPNDVNTLRQDMEARTPEILIVGTAPSVTEPGVVYIETEEA